MLKKNSLKTCVSLTLALSVLLAGMVMYETTRGATFSLSAGAHIDQGSLPASSLTVENPDRYPDVPRHTTIPQIKAIKRVKRSTTLFPNFVQAVKRQVVPATAAIFYDRLQATPSFEKISLKTIRKVVLLH